MYLTVQGYVNLLKDKHFLKNNNIETFSPRKLFDLSSFLYISLYPEEVSCNGRRNVEKTDILKTIPLLQDLTY